ncbi:MAG: aminoacyl-tRNA hydrolase [bacterium]|nr:aminoacyl-tRNA hydrolase [bacterium]
MKLIVGLGNPGREYENTRHNIGFFIIDKFANKLGILITKSKFNGLYGETSIRGEKVILLKPQSYINLSGEVIRKFVDFYKISISDILIIHDDLDLNVGVYKIKQRGSSGGHNGLKNIEIHLGTQEYKRIKIGISNNKNIDTKDYVLGKFSKEDQEKLTEIQEVILQILEDYFKVSFLDLMGKYNHR